MRYDLFFPFDSQIARIFCSLMRLAAIRMVTYMTHGRIFVQAERGQLATYLKMVSGQERLYPNIMSPVRLGKYVWVWFVNEDDWTRKLDHYTVGFSQPEPIGWRGWVKACGTHKYLMYIKVVLNVY